MIESLNKSKGFEEHIVLVEWIDAQAQLFDSLVSIEDLKGVKPVITKSVGFLVKENKYNYVLVTELWEESRQVKYIHIIPRVLVRRVERLVVKK